MFLSRVELDLRSRVTMRALAAPQRFHGAVEAAFAGDRARRLWRLDRLDGRLFLLIVSEARPDLMGIAAQFGPRAGQGLAPTTRDYAPFLGHLAAGQVCRFRLAANPVENVSGRATPDAPRPRGKPRAHCTVAHQERWLSERAARLGFSATNRAGEATFRVTESRWLRFVKHGAGRPVSILAVAYEGLLRIKDPDRFRETLTHGVGRGKAYGLGLLTVIPQG